MVSNYFKSGPASKKSTKNRITSIDLDENPSICPPGFGMYFIKGNYVFGFKDVTRDNWKGVVIPNSVSKDSCKETKAFPFGTIKKQSATKAYSMVLKLAGASLKRDTVDRRIVREVKDGTFTFTGSNGSTNGIIDTQKDVGGWPVYSYNESQNLVDTDADGMPDVWEEQHGLNKNDASDGAKYMLNKSYTNLEMYLNGLINN